MDQQQLTPDQAVELAVAHHRAGRLAEAETIYRQVLAVEPMHLGATRMLGVLASQCGNHADGVTLLTRAYHANPSDVATALDLAVACRTAEKMAEADHVYQSTLSRNLDSPAVLSAYGQFMTQVGRIDDAIALFGRAAEVAPSVGTFNQLGIALAARERFAEAAEAFNRCMAIDPSFATAYNNLGTSLLHQHKLADAEAMFRNAVAVDATYAQALDNLGTVMVRQNRHADALPMLERAVAAQPAAPQPHESLSAALLATGDWARGFTEREAWVNRTNGAVPPGVATRPRWDGSDLKGRTILLHAADGPADAILFARYVPLVARRGGRVVLLCPRPLAQLFGRLPGVQRIVGPGDDLPPFDVQRALASLPQVFGTLPESVPSAKAAYLSAPPEVIQKWKDAMSGAAGKRVGIAWGANPRDALLAPHAVPPVMLAPLSRVAGVTFFRLPSGYATDSNESPPGLPIVDHLDALTDPADVAGLLKNLDLVITCDAPIAHLAGAVGRPTALMLAFSADWRWMVTRGDSPWYGSTRLYRQPTPGDWKNVVERVARSLEAWAKK